MFPVWSPAFTAASPRAASPRAALRSRKKGRLKAGLQTRPFGVPLVKPCCCLALLLSKRIEQHRQLFAQPRRMGGVVEDRIAAFGMQQNCQSVAIEHQPRQE